MEWDGSSEEDLSSASWDRSFLFNPDSGSSSVEPCSQPPCVNDCGISSDPPVPSSVSCPEAIQEISRTPSNGARLNGRNYFLTYSQTTLTKERVLEALTALGAVTRMIVGQEVHPQTGGTHVHVFVMFQKKKDVTPSHFDVDNVHPNVRIPNAFVGTIQQSWLNLWNYCKKEDRNPIIVGSAPEVKRSKNEIAKEAFRLAEEESVSAAVSFLKVESGFEMLKNWTGLEKSLVLARARCQAIGSQGLSYPLESFKLQGLPTDFHALFITGPSGIGKTQLAKALLPGATVIRHTDQLRNCDFSKGIVFDDYDVSHWPVTAIIHLLDWDEASGINVKHGHVLIPAHTKKVFTHNRPLHQWLPKDIPPEQYDAVSRRLIQIELPNTKLY